MAVKKNSDEARSAVHRLCEDYYRPVLNFVRRTILHNNFQYGSWDAEDLVQDFFLRVLQGEEFRHLERHRGRFRSYLLGAVKFFLADVRDKESAQKRGGQNTTIPLKDEIVEVSDDFDAKFDRDWAETVVARCVDQLREEAEKENQPDRFEHLRPWLAGEPGETQREETMAELCISKEHFHVLVSRLRKKFRVAVRARIAETVDSDSEVATELDYLIRALS